MKSFGAIKNIETNILEFVYEVIMITLQSKLEKILKMTLKSYICDFLQMPLNLFVCKKVMV